MTIRVPVSNPQNLWADATEVTKDDLNVEQNFVNQTTAGIVSNFFGSGILPDSIQPTVLFDTESLGIREQELARASDFDGNWIPSTLQPSDINLGCQLNIELTDGYDVNGNWIPATVFGRDSVKVAIIGLSFDDELIVDRFYFHRKDRQTTAKHYKRILSVFFNDFWGNNNCSKFLGGRIIITEANPMQLSRQALSLAQDVQPDIFWRDFRIADCTKTLFDVIQEGVGPSYDANNLNIQTGPLNERKLSVGDVTTRYAQKFLATTSNIQKVTLLLGVTAGASGENQFDWSGDLIFSIHKLQTNVDCVADIIPDLAIEYDPEDKPIVEISFSQLEMVELGYVLTDVVQPVDFVVTNTTVANAGGITAGQYYVIMVRRSGDAGTGELFIDTGEDRLSNSRLSIFAGGIWIDQPQEDMWFQVWSDAAKITSGQAYDSGYGIMYTKTTTDSTTGSQIDYQVNHLSFINTGSNVLNTGLVQATLDQSLSAQNELTGNDVFTRQQRVPEFNFVTTSQLNTLKETSEPFIVGCLSDQNPKTKNLISGIQSIPGLVKCNHFIVVDPQPDLLSTNLIGRKLIPEQSCSNFAYKIFRTTLCTDGYGDVNGDGEITQEDYDLAASLVNKSIFDEATQQQIVDGTVDTLQLLRADVDGDGYVTANDLALIEAFLNRTLDGYGFPAGTYFTHLDIEVQPVVGRNDSIHKCYGPYSDGYTADGTFYPWGCLNGDGYLRTDGYCDPNVRVRPEDLSDWELSFLGNDIIPCLDCDNPVFNAVPFAPITYDVVYQPFWEDYLIAESSEAKILPASFSFNSGVERSECVNQIVDTCESRVITPVSCDPGRNDMYFPDNLIIGRGDILRPDGSPIKTDFEIGTIILEIPATQIFFESAIDVWRDLVLENADGKTRSNYPAMKYYDCTYVQPEDLFLNRVRFEVSIEAYIPNVDGYDPIDGYGLIVDNIIGVYMDPDTGILKLTMKNLNDLEENGLYKTLITKLMISVYLRKSGWNNKVLTVGSDQIAGLIVS